MELAASVFVGSLVTSLTLIRFVESGPVEIAYSTIKGEIGTLRTMETSEQTVELIQIEDYLTSHYPCPLMNPVREYLSTYHPSCVCENECL